MAIDKFTEENAGIYTCIANNDIANVTIIEMHVQGKSIGRVLILGKLCFI